MKDLIEEDATMRPFTPANRSRATRMFAARSKASARGFVVATLPAQQHPRQIIFESHLEQKVLLERIPIILVHILWQRRMICNRPG